jgi:hypothetical protein
MVVEVVEFMLDAPAFALSGGWDFHFDSYCAVCEGGGVHTIARQVVVIWSWWAALSSNFFITNTLTYRLETWLAFRLARP